MSPKRPYHVLNRSKSGFSTTKATYKLSQQGCLVVRSISTISRATELLRNRDYDPVHLKQLSASQAFQHTPFYYPDDLKQFYQSIEYGALEAELLSLLGKEKKPRKRLTVLMSFLKNQIIQGHAVEETHLVEWFRKYLKVEKSDRHEKTELFPVYQATDSPSATKPAKFTELEMHDILNHVTSRLNKPSVEFMRWLSEESPVLCEQHLFRCYVKDLLTSRGFNVEGEGKIDLTNPQELYPDARMLTRRIICHLGPTNSGKTYRALERLKEANNGYYAGPLRLLARETYDRIKDDGLRINLKTGEEVINDEDAFGNPAPLTAGTIEMIDTNQLMDVCVIDEIQMLNDQSRGWAWLNAVVGVQAREVHLCGEESVIDVIRAIAEKTGDTVEINTYERLGTLEMEDRPLRDLTEVRPGDCVVAFSRRKVFEYREQIEATTPYKCSIVYGALPPETRVTQSRDFNTGKTSVLVATDAVGMGLNLSIARIVFAAIRKYDGTGDYNLLTPPQAKQIAGRAGRYKVPGSDKVGSVGYVTSLQKSFNRYVHECLLTPTVMLKTLYVKPQDDQFVPLVSSVKGLAKLMARMKELTVTADGYTLPSFESQLELSDACFQGLSIDQALNISGLPFGSTDYCMAQVMGMTRALAQGTVYTCAQLALPALDRFFLAPFAVDRLKIMEDLHKMISAYRWLQNRYPHTFVDIEGVTKLRFEVENTINGILKDSKAGAEGGNKRNHHYKGNNGYGNGKGKGSKGGYKGKAHWEQVKGDQRR